jgi:hypothetical protein
MGWIRRPLMDRGPGGGLDRAGIRHQVHERTCVCAAAENRPALIMRQINPHPDIGSTRTAERLETMLQSKLIIVCLFWN